MSTHQVNTECGSTECVSLGCVWTEHGTVTQSISAERALCLCQLRAVSSLFILERVETSLLCPWSWSLLLLHTANTRSGSVNELLLLLWLCVQTKIQSIHGLIESIWHAWYPEDETSWLFYHPRDHVNRIFFFKSGIEKSLSTLLAIVQSWCMALLAAHGKMSRQLCVSTERTSVYHVIRATVSLPHLLWCC